MLADHAHIRLLGIGVLETVSEPVGHRIAEHQHVTFRYGFALGRRRGPGEILARRLRCLLLLLLLERRKDFAAEPAAPATLRRRPLRLTAETAETEIKELRGGRARDPDQHRNRNRQRDQQAGLGEHAQEGLRLRQHRTRSQWVVRRQNIIAESGRKRADFAPISRASRNAVKRRAK